jgi:hypothetical protein
VGIVLLTVVGFGSGVLWLHYLPQYAPSALWHRIAGALPDLLFTFALLVIIAYGGRAVWRRMYTRTRMIEGEALGPIFFTDQPESGQKDTFALTAISKQLARDVQLPPGSPSLVVSLEGAWGSGKTTLLNAVTEQLKGASTRPIVITFNTWELPAGEVLAQSLLKSMSAGITDHGGDSSLDNALEGLGEDIDQLMAKKKDSMPTALFSTILKLIGLTEFGDVRKYKSRINARLAELHVPIVVLIDDVDRLMPADIRNVFQLVHGAIDFTRVCYVLAYDPVPIHQALATHPGDTNSGLKFKEKIVQVAIPFPRISPLRRHQFVSSLLNEAMARRSLTADPNDSARRADAISILLQLLRTPRAIKQGVNKIGFSAELLSGEVCLSDIVVFESIQLHSPSLTQQLRDRPELILQLHQQDEVYSPVTMQIVHELHKKESQQKALGALVKDAVQDDLSGQTRINGALRFLFPSLFSKDSIHSEDPGPLGRIDDPNNLKKLLYLTTQPDSASTREVREFLENPASRTAILADRSTATAVASFFNQVARFFSNTNEVKEARGLIDKILECADVWLSSEGEDLTRDAADLIEHLLNDANMSPADRLSLLRYVSLEAPRLSIGANVLTSAFRQLGLWNEGVWHPEGLHSGQSDAPWGWLTSTDAERLRVEWIERFDALDWEDLAIREAQFSGLLYRRAQYDNNNYSAVQSRLRELLMTSDDAARYFARPYGGGWSASGLEKLVPDMYWFHERLKTVKASEAAIENIRDQFESLITQGPTDR